MPAGIIERYAMLLDVHGVFRIIPLECTIHHNGDIISNDDAIRQYENIANLQYRTSHRSRIRVAHLAEWTSGAS